MVPRTILSKLGRLRRRERLLTLAAGLCHWLAIALAALLLACLADWWIDRDRDTPWAIRQSLVALQLLVAVGAAGYLIIRPQLRRLRDDTLALWVEENQPTFAHRLITAVQLGRPGAQLEGMSPELISVVMQEAEQRSAALDFAQVADRRRLRRAAQFLAPLLIVAALPWLFFPKLAAVLVARQFQADIDIPHSVLLEPVHAEQVRPAGEPLTLWFRVTTDEVDPDWIGDVFVTPEGQARDRYSLEFQRREGSSALFAASVAPSSVNLRYTARLQDGRMRRPAMVRMVPRPVVTEHQAWLQLPAFCGVKPDKSRYEQPQGRGDVVGIPGSSVRVTIKTQRPIERGWLELFGPASDKAGSEGESAPEVLKRNVEVSLGPDAAAGEAVFDLRPDESAYRIMVRDEHEFYNQPAPRRTLKLVPEEPPQVVLLKEQMPPAGPLAAGVSWEDFEVDGLPIVPGKKIRVAYVAQGQYGLGRARFLYRIVRKTESGSEEVKDEPWRSVDLYPIEAGPKSGAFDPKRGVFEHSPLDEIIGFHAVPSPNPDLILGRTLGGGRYDFETSGIADGKGGLVPLKVGDQLEFCVEVFADKNPESKRPSARSEIRTRPIISGEDFARWFADALQEERRLKDLDQKQRGVFELR